jgi:hypothetical protein
MTLILCQYGICIRLKLLQTFKIYIYSWCRLTLLQFLISLINYVNSKKNQQIIQTYSFELQNKSTPNVRQAWLDKCAIRAMREN